MSTTTVSSFVALIEQSLVQNWDKDALTDYKGKTLQYHDVARKIVKMHIAFERAGIRPGDKVAICGRNSAMWAVSFLAIVSYGAVIVPVQNEFKPEQIYNIVNHSDSRLLFVGDVVSTQLDFEQMPGLLGAVYIPDSSLILSRSDELTYAREHLNELFGKKYPRHFGPEHIGFFRDDPEGLCMINYTSGTTGFSKGVMLPYRAIWSNVEQMTEAMTVKIPRGSKILEILPMGHMYGLIDEFLVNFCYGNHLYFLSRRPSPTVIQQAFEDLQPAMIVSVPLIIEKIIKEKIFPLVNNYRVKLLMKAPGVGKVVRQRILEKVMQVLGGNLYQVMIGGASLSKQVEDFFVSIDFPITVGYGATETAPMITFSDYHDFVPGSCGTPVSRMEVKIMSSDPANVPGELLARGTNVMLGYYKNPEATAETIDKDGWFHSGDLAKMSEDGHVFILGRIKNMLLASNGQNVYPEEIEDKLNSMTMVAESIVLQKGEKFVALVYPNKDMAGDLGLTDDDLVGVMEQNRKELNAKLPSFSRIAEIKLYDKEFERTPKKSIKRYLYKNMV